MIARRFCLIKLRSIRAATAQAILANKSHFKLALVNKINGTFRVSFRRRSHPMKAFPFYFYEDMLLLVSPKIGYCGRIYKG